MENYDEVMDHEQLIPSENECDDEVVMDTFDDDLAPEEELDTFEEDIDFSNEEVYFEDDDLPVANG